MADGTNTVYSRSHQTKMKVVAAFNELCKEESYAKIHIDSIAKAAGISRSSFYHHFADKNAVIQWFTLLFYTKGLDQTGRTLTWFEGHMVTTRGFCAFSPLFTSAAEVREYGGGQPFYIRHRQQTLLETITDYKKLELTDRLRFQIEALPYAEKTMANNFQNAMYSFSVKEYCDHMVSLVPRELFEALEHPVNPDPFHGSYLDSPWV